MPMGREETFNILHLNLSKCENSCGRTGIVTELWVFFRFSLAFAMRVTAYCKQPV